jgi:hypothetical protein
MRRTEGIASGAFADWLRARLRTPALSTLYSRVTPLVLIFVTLAIPALVFVRVWAGPAKERAHFWGDPPGTYWGDLVVIARIAGTGRFPLWNPFDRGGDPICADPEPGVLYPVNWLFVAFSALTKNSDFALMQAKILLHIGLAGVAMLLFLRARSLRPAAALGGAVAYTLGPYLMNQAQYSLVWPTAWLPFVLLATDHLFRARTLGSAMLFSIATFCLVVAGSFPGAFYCALVAIPYFVFVFVQTLRSAPTALRELALPVACSLALTALLVLGPLWATDVSRSVSVRAEPSLAYAFGQAVPPAEFLGFLLRSARSEYVYIGLPALLLAGLGAVSWLRRGEALLWTAIAAAGVVLATGEHSGLLRLLYMALPPFRWFGLAVRYLFLTNFAVAVLVAFGIDRLVGPSRRVRRAAWVVGSIVLVVLFAYVTITAQAVAMPSQVRNKAIIGDLGWCLFVGAITAAGVFAAWRRRHRLSGALVVGALILDLGIVAQRSGTLHAGAFNPQGKVSDALMTRIRERATSYRVFDEGGMNWRPGARFGLRDLRGYMGPLTTQALNDVYVELRANPELVAVFNVKYLLHAPLPIWGMSHHRLPEPQRIPGIRKLERAAFEIADVAPYAYWVGRAELVDSSTHAAKALSAGDWHKRIVLAADDLAPEQIAFARSLRSDRSLIEASIQESLPGRVRVRVNAPERGWVVFNEKWFPGWRARVDGRSARVLRANALVQAVEIEAGSHEVEFVFEPRYFLVPLYIACAAVALVGVAASVQLRRRRTKLAQTAVE